MIAGANIEQQLFDHVANSHNSEIITPNGIIIEAVEDGSLQAEYKFINTENTTLSIILDCKKKVFVDSLNITSIEDIDALTPMSFIEVYEKGLAEIVCFVTLNYSYCLSFKKCGNLIMATNESNVEHIIPDPEKPETHDQYIDYTQRYYQLPEAAEN
jgi:hypothetical protein